MNKTKNSRVSKAQALGLVTYLTYNTDYHFDFDVSKDRCDIDIYCHSGAELVSLEMELRPFIVDGCSLRTDELSDPHCWCLTYKFPCVWSHAK